MTALGLLAPLGGSLSDLRRAGQLDRMVGYYLPAYLEHFARVAYFSYEPERIEDLTDDPQLRARVDLLVPGRARHRALRALDAARGADRAELRRCALLRAFQAPGALPALLAGVPYVCTYGYSYPDFTLVPGRGLPQRALLGGKRAGMRAGLGLLLRRASLTIVTSGPTEAEARGLGAHHTVRIPNGADLSRFSPAAAARPEHDVVFVGRLVEQKRIDRLLRALALLPQPPSLLVVGEGPARGSLEALARDLGVPASFSGAIPNERLPGVLRGARMFALPSELEGHPKALIEAMATGLPCVAVDIPALRELAGAVELVPRDSPPALSAAIARLLADPAAAAALGGRARELALAEFDLRTNVRREAELLAAQAAVRR